MVYFVVSDTHSISFDDNLSQSLCHIMFYFHIEAVVVLILVENEYQSIQVKGPIVSLFEHEYLPTNNLFEKK